AWGHDFLSQSIAPSVSREASDSRGFRPACKASFCWRYWVSEPPGTSHGLMVGNFLHRKSAVCVVRETRGVTSRVCFEQAEGEKGEKGIRKGGHSGRESGGKGRDARNPPAKVFFFERLFKGLERGNRRIKKRSKRRPVHELGPHSSMDRASVF